MGDSVYAGARLAGQVRDVLLGGRALVRQGHFEGAGTGGTYLSSLADLDRTAEPGGVG